MQESFYQAKPDMPKEHICGLHHVQAADSPSSISPVSVLAAGDYSQRKSSSSVASFTLYIFWRENAVYRRISTLKQFLPATSSSFLAELVGKSGSRQQGYQRQWSQAS
mmetsp:Transcript_28430/g.111495  ORF Transcript_28430/g.111495 Transcript_28430/m.111495 type:complete len:108 (+) Transcript_28430:2538-2861(+)